MPVHSVPGRVGYVVCFLWFSWTLHMEVQKVLRFSSCLLMVCSPAEYSLRHAKVFVAVCSSNTKQVCCSQTGAKPAVTEQLRSQTLRGQGTDSP